MKPRLLDLFCGAGGAARGYQEAGFYVVGVDIAPQPNYCGDEFVQRDVMDFGRCDWWRTFDAIHASPPCQAYTTMSNRWRGAGGKADQHDDLLVPTYELLKQTGVPFVIENVVGAHITTLPLPWLRLHGAMFGLGVHRPRNFWSWPMQLFGMPHVPKVRDPVGVYGKAHDGRRLFDRADGTTQYAAADLEEAREAMGIDWMTWDEIREAIPPAYCRFIGEQLLAALPDNTEGG